MKNVTVASLGQPAKPLETSSATIGDLAKELGLGDNLSIKVNGQTAESSDTLVAYSYITFGEKIKGGL